MRFVRRHGGDGWKLSDSVGSAVNVAGGDSRPLPCGAVRRGEATADVLTLTSGRSQASCNQAEWLQSVRLVVAVRVALPPSAGGGSADASNRFSVIGVRLLTDRAKGFDSHRQAKVRNQIRPSPAPSAPRPLAQP